MSWLHVARLQDAFDRDGWIVIPARQAPTLATFLSQTILSNLLKPLPHLGGWWVAESASNALDAVLELVALERDLCASCLSDGAPCEVAAATALANISAMIAQQQLYDRSRERAEQDRHAFAYDSRSRARDRQARERVRSHSFSKPPGLDPGIKAASKVLNLSWPATKDAVRRAFRKAAIKRHPDMGGTDQAMIEAVVARDVLLRYAS